MSKIRDYCYIVISLSILLLCNGNTIGNDNVNGNGNTIDITIDNAAVDDVRSRNTGNSNTYTYTYTSITTGIGTETETETGTTDVDIDGTSRNLKNNKPTPTKPPVPMPIPAPKPEPAPEPAPAPIPSPPNTDTPGNTSTPEGKGQSPTKTPPVSAPTTTSTSETTTSTTLKVGTVYLILTLTSTSTNNGDDGINIDDVMILTQTQEHFEREIVKFIDTDNTQYQGSESWTIVETNLQIPERRHRHLQRRLGTGTSTRSSSTTIMTQLEIDGTAKFNKEGAPDQNTMMIIGQQIFNDEYKDFIISKIQIANGNGANSNGAIIEGTLYFGSKPDPIVQTIGVGGKSTNTGGIIGGILGAFAVVGILSILFIKVRRNGNTNKNGNGNTNGNYKTQNGNSKNKNKRRHLMFSSPDNVKDDLNYSLDNELANFRIVDDDHHHHHEDESYNSNNSNNHNRNNYNPKDSRSANVISNDDGSAIETVFSTTRVPLSPCMERYFAPSPKRKIRQSPIRTRRTSSSISFHTNNNVNNVNVDVDTYSLDGSYAIDDNKPNKGETLLGHVLSMNKYNTISPTDASHMNDSIDEEGEFDEEEGFEMDISVAGDLSTYSFSQECNNSVAQSVVSRNSFAQSVVSRNSFAQSIQSALRRGGNKGKSINTSNNNSTSNGAQKKNHKRQTISELRAAAAEQNASPARSHIIFDGTATSPGINVVPMEKGETMQEESYQLHQPQSQSQHQSQYSNRSNNNNNNNMVIPDSLTAPSLLDETFSSGDESSAISISDIIDHPEIDVETSESFQNMILGAVDQVIDDDDDNDGSGDVDVIDDDDDDDDIQYTEDVKEEAEEESRVWDEMSHNVVATEQTKKNCFTSFLPASQPQSQPSNLSMRRRQPKITVITSSAPPSPKTPPERYPIQSANKNSRRMRGTKSSSSRSMTKAHSDYDSDDESYSSSEEYDNPNYVSEDDESSIEEEQRMMKRTHQRHEKASSRTSKSTSSKPTNKQKQQQQQQQQHHHPSFSLANPIPNPMIHRNGGLQNKNDNEYNSASARNARRSRIAKSIERKSKSNSKSSENTWSNSKAEMASNLRKTRLQQQKQQQQLKSGTSSLTPAEKRILRKSRLQQRV